MISETIYGCSRGSVLKISEGNFVIQEIYSCPKTGGKGGVKQVMMSKQTHEFFQRQIFLWKKFFFYIQNTLKHNISKVFFEKVKKNRTFLLISTKPLQKGRCIRCTLHGLSPGVSLFLIRSSISQQFWNRLILTIQKMGRVWPYGQQKRFYRYKRVSSHSGIVVIPKSRRWKFVAWHVCGSAGCPQNVYSKLYGSLTSLQ